MIRARFRLVRPGARHFPLVLSEPRESPVSHAEPSSTPGAVHRPVLPAEVVEGLAPKPGAILVDGTVGAGGHAALLADRVAPGGLVVGLDRDTEMLALAEKALAGRPVRLIHSPYDEFPAVLDELGIGEIDGIVLDLGLSSDQLAWTRRGFSFRDDGPLDMRYDATSNGPTAEDLIHESGEEELADIFFQYGEERHSRRVARRIVEARRVERIRTTGRLAEIVRRGIPGKWGPIDPATRVFQALRIAVNDELGRLDRVLKAIPKRLKIGGRAAIISFHSLEDRRVKNAFRDDPDLTPVTRKPIVASAEEIQLNPRARSAKLRVAERCTRPTGTDSRTDDAPKTWRRRKRS